ncbi:MAG: hypothetical protein EOP52_10810 [Sphingobacteriales bacterium]|nr:MAG: hypothetical protein EOP52_10810 [Sphingobacteriales bacterium]
MQKTIVLLILLFSAVRGVAQQDEDLFGSLGGSDIRQGVLIGAQAGYDLPFGDMSKRFGPSFRVGGSLQYRLKNNWQFGVKGDFIFGTDLREDSLLINMKDVSGFYINDNGRRVGMEIAERGYLLGLTGGKMISLSKNHPNRGVLLQLTAGYMQHRVFYYNQQDNFAQLRGEYKKGYDRLTNGLFVEPYVGYQHFSDNGLVNFHVGVGATLGFTAGRRDYQFDLARPYTESRLDGLFGVRAGWYFAIYRKRTEDIYY